MDDWTEVVHPKKAKREEKKKMEEKWKKLEEEHPHIMTPQKISLICKRVNISNLENKLKSEEWINYQISGWIFVKVLTALEEDARRRFLKEEHEDSPINRSEEFSALPIQNKWGDYALFKRNIRLVHDFL